MWEVHLLDGYEVCELFLCQENLSEFGRVIDAGLVEDGVGDTDAPWGNIGGGVDGEVNRFELH